MRYTVVWDRPALDDLARIWIDASNRQAVADATDDIEPPVKELFI